MKDRSHWRKILSDHIRSSRCLPKPNEKPGLIVDQAAKARISAAAEKICAELRPTSGAREVTETPEQALERIKAEGWGALVLSEGARNLSTRPGEAALA